MKQPDIMIFTFNNVQFVNYIDSEGKHCIATINTVIEETEKYTEYIRSVGIFK